MLFWSVGDTFSTFFEVNIFFFFALSRLDFPGALLDVVASGGYLFYLFFFFALSRTNFHSFPGALLDVVASGGYGTMPRTISLLIVG